MDIDSNTFDRKRIEKLNAVDLALWLEEKGLESNNCGLLEGT